jgi:hypothetical protein
LKGSRAGDLKENKKTIKKVLAIRESLSYKARPFLEMGTEILLKLRRSEVFKIIGE